MLPRRARLLVLGSILAAFAALGLYASAQDHDAHPQPHGEAKHENAKPHGEHGGHADHDKEHAEHKEMTATEHVGDADEIHVFTSIWPHHIPLPKIFGFQITKFMVLEALASLLVLAIFIPLGQRIRHGEPARGWFWNCFEVLLTFVRNEIAKPSLGEDKADTYVPFLWTMFLFILVNNLLGMIPFLGSATASIYVTGALALIVFFAIHGSAIMSMGSAPAHGHGHGDDHGHDHAHDDHGHGRDHHEAPATPQNPVLVFVQGTGRYLYSIWPQIDVPIPIVGFLIKALVFVIEIVGILVRNGVLAVRLFANMFAGHMVLATILMFITMAAGTPVLLWGTITASSVFGIVALSLLEIFVAFLQAYIFTFLAALFMGMAINPQH
jgi:F-type H+-transporting ATPase subunit a